VPDNAATPQEFTGAPWGNTAGLARDAACDVLELLVRQPDGRYAALETLAWLVDRLTPDARQQYGAALEHAWATSNAGQGYVEWLAGRLWISLHAVPDPRPRDASGETFSSLTGRERAAFMRLLALGQRNAIVNAALQAQRAAQGRISLTEALLGMVAILVEQNAILERAAIETSERS
jgi:hypothetical protein